MPDRIGRHEAPIEMDAFDLRVGGQHLVARLAPARSPRHRRRGRSTTHGGIETRALMRAMSARSPMSATVRVLHRDRRSVAEAVGSRTQEAPLCRVGRSNEPAKAGGAAVIGRASGFLETEACTTRDLAAHLGVTLAQTSLRKPSRAKQELEDLTVRPGAGQAVR